MVRRVKAPTLAFAGIWTTWRGTRGTKASPVEGEHHLFGFLTTEANAVVAPIHPKAMPVILRNEAEFEGWLSAPADVALALQRPLPDDELRIWRRASGTTMPPNSRCRAPPLQTGGPAGTIGSLDLASSLAGVGRRLACAPQTCGFIG